MGAAAELLRGLLKWFGACVLIFVGLTAVLYVVATVGGFFEVRLGTWVTIGLILVGMWLYDSGRKRGRQEGPEDA